MPKKQENNIRQLLEGKVHCIMMVIMQEIRTNKQNEEEGMLTNGHEYE